MTKNIGRTDRAIRIILAFAFAILVAGSVVEGILAWILGILSVTLIVTSFVRWCPLYAPLKISTIGKSLGTAGKPASR